MKPFTIADYLQLKQPEEAQINPDGSMVAYTVAEVGKEAADKPARSQIWLTPAGDGPARLLTAGPGRDFAPRWSPAGDRLAFLSDRAKPGKSVQICLLEMAGGEAQVITEAKGEIRDCAWTRGGASIAFLMTDPEPEPKTDVIAFEDRPRFQRLYLLDLATREIRPVTPEGVQVWEFAESPDGSAFALVASALPWEWSWYQAYIGVVPAGGGRVAEVCRTERQVALPAWSPDGRQIAFLSSYWSDRGVVAGGLWLVGAEGGAPRHVTDGYEGSLAWMEWERDGTLIFMGCEGLETTIGQIAPDGKRNLFWRGSAAFEPRWWPRFSRAGNRFAAVRADLEHLPDVWVGDLAGDSFTWRPRTNSNPQAAELSRGTARTIRWRSQDDLEMEGILLVPADHREGERLPLVTMVHGGPTSLFGARPNLLWAPFLANAGIAVLMPNPRGSTGRGLTFAEANLGDMGGRDLADILAGVDACVAAGIADPERLGIAGWSYGGYMAAWATTQTDRFKAAVVGAGIVNWLSFHGTSEIPTWDVAYMKADPYSGEAYARWSPVAHVGKVRTPTLILHGEKDNCVPVGQAYEWFRALREHGVEARLRVYPREEHGLRERPYLLDMQQGTVDWFVKHLGAAGSSHHPD